MHGDLWKHAPIHERKIGCGTELFSMACLHPYRIDTGRRGVEEPKMTRLQEIPWIRKDPIDLPTIRTRKVHGQPGRLNLYRLPWLRPLISSRWPQLLIRILALSGFLFTITAGLFGTLVGGHNFAIIFVWIAWWTALKLAFIPLGGRSWCSICPIPLPGEWLQRGGILITGKHRRGFNLHWPKQLRGSWMQSSSFLVLGMFSALTLTDPHVTGWVLLGLFGLATGLSLIFEKRAFCSYLCPIGGFSGMYAQTSPVEVRVIDKEICAGHKVKSCYQARPWGTYPVALRDSSACGLCMECLRACPENNLAVNLRPFGTDLGNKRMSSRLDEAFLALVMLGSVMAFTAIFTGPWGWLKTAAFEIGSKQWVFFVLGYLAINLLIFPGFFTLFVWLGQKTKQSRISLQQSIATKSQVLIPLGLMAWIAFTISFVLPKLSLILEVVNDPFGWGWHLLGIHSALPVVDVSAISMIIQAALLMVGFFWSARLSQKLTIGESKSLFRVNIPILSFNLIFTAIMLWLLVG